MLRLLNVHFIRSFPFGFSFHVKRLFMLFCLFQEPALVYISLGCNRYKFYYIKYRMQRLFYLGPWVTTATEFFFENSEMLQPNKHSYCWRCVKVVFKSSWRFFQRRNFLSFKIPWRRLPDVLQWRTHLRPLQLGLKTSWKTTKY